MLDCHVACCVTYTATVGNRLPAGLWPCGWVVAVQGYDLIVWVYSPRQHILPVAKSMLYQD
jgi:hypothetical protein